MSDQQSLPIHALRAFDVACAHQWAMQEEHLRALLEVASRAPGPAIEALAARRDKPLDNTARSTVRNGVAVVPMMGPLFRYANIFTELSGATSLQIMATDFNAALADPQVKAILLNTDSPGGEVNGVAEMAQAVMAARGKKPVAAYVGHAGASGAYWIASAADKVFLSPTAMVGSIGAVMTVRDSRARDEKTGVRTIEIVSSVSPDKRADPATDDGKAKLQAVVDRLGEVFVAAVAAQRGVSVDTVLADFGKGGVLVGSDAVATGMADDVSSFEAVLASLSSAGSPGGGSGRVFTPRAAPAAASEKSKMSDIKTTADLEAAYPDLVAAIRNQAATTAKAAGVAEGEKAGTEAGTNAGETAGHAAGVTAERTRILGIQAHAMPGAEKLVAQFVADGTTTPDQAGAKILAELKQQGPRALAALKADEKKPAAQTGGKDGAAEVTADQVADAIRAEMAAAEKDGKVLSFAAAAAKVRAKANAAA